MADREPDHEIRDAVKLFPHVRPRLPKREDGGIFPMGRGKFRNKTYPEFPIWVLSCAQSYAGCLSWSISTRPGRSSTRSDLPARVVSSQVETSAPLKEDGPRCSPCSRPVSSAFAHRAIAVRFPRVAQTQIYRGLRFVTKFPGRGVRRTLPAYSADQRIALGMFDGFHGEVDIKVGPIQMMRM